MLRPRVGRLLNDKMPTGVAVSPAMNHGGPYPRPAPRVHGSGIPAALGGLAVLQCLDSVRLLCRAAVAARPLNDRVVRLVDGEWRRGAV